jgi:hypothetical protein
VNRTGRPLRAMAGLGAVMLAWLGWRVPQLAAEAARLRAGLDLPVMIAAVPPTAMPAGPGPVMLAALPQPAPPIPPRLQRVPSRPVPLQHPERLEPPLRPALVGAVPPPQPEAVPASPVVAASPDNRAFSLADQAYRRLEQGQRRQAAALFDAALALEPANRQWQADRKALARRWQLGGFALLRDGGPPLNAPGSGLPGFAASPVLGGGQVGASLAFLPDPLARRPLAIVARANMAAGSAGVQRETAQAAIGVRQTLLPGVTLSAERLIALGDATRGDWTLRLAAGGARGRLDAYGEAGVLAGGTVYGGAQATARVLRIGPASFNAGSWASVQTGQGAGTPDVWRVDVGPSVAARWHGVRLQADWRERVGGNAAPSSGPVLTVSAGF